MEEHMFDDAPPARGERDEPSEVPPGGAEESVPAQELSPEDAAAADSDHAPVPDSKSSARIAQDV